MPFLFNHVLERNGFFIRVVLCIKYQSKVEVGANRYLYYQEKYININPIRILNRTL